MGHGYCHFPAFLHHFLLKKNRVGRLAKKLFLQYFFGQKCVFYACLKLIGSWKGGKNFRVGIFLNKTC